MATDIVNNVLSNQLALNQLSPSSLIDLVTNNAIIDKLKGSNNGNIGKFIMTLILAIELKSMLIETIKSIFKTIKGSEFYKNVTEKPLGSFFNLIKNIFKFLYKPQYISKLFKRVTKENKNINKFERPENYASINFMVTNEINEQLINYIKEHGSYTIYDKIIYGMSNMTNKTMKMKYTNLEFNIDNNVKCKLGCDLELTYLNNKLTNIVINNNYDVVPIPDSKFLKMINNDFIVKLLVHIKKRISDEPHDYDIQTYINQFKIYSNVPFNKMLQLDDNDTFYFLILCILDDLSDLKTYVTKCDKFFRLDRFNVRNKDMDIIQCNPNLKFEFDENFKLLFKDQQTRLSIFKFIDINGEETKFDVYLNQIQKYKTLCCKIGKTYDECTFTNKVNDSSSTTSSTSAHMTCHLVSKEYVKPEILYKMFNEFMDTKILIPIEFSEIKIYEIKNVKKEKIIDVDNPDYEKFMDQQKLIKELQSVNKDAKIDISSIIIPQKQIKKTETTFEIESKEINTCKKNINTLYLRETDIGSLKCVLDQFKNNKELYSTLDIPRKIGFMFYGEPGTGKSTAIKAISTYLKKNIYFVNLNGVTKNSELKNIFDNVTLNCSNGGIIVFEDIDCMTDIVKSRKVSKESTLVSTIGESDDKLSLSYFLNLLDGTLTSNESVFIMTTNHIEKIDKAIYRSGRVDVAINFKLCDHYQIKQIYKNFMRREIDSDVLSTIQPDKYSPADIIFHLMQNIYNKAESDDVIMSKFMN
jgi:hypothetical protein